MGNSEKSDTQTCAPDQNNALSGIVPQLPPSSLTEICRLISETNPSLDAIFEKTLQASIAATRSAGGYIFALNTEGSYNSSITVSLARSTSFQTISSIPTVNNPDFSSYCELRQQILRHRLPIITTNPAEFPFLMQMLALTKTPKGMLSYPLYSGKEQVGAMALVWIESPFCVFDESVLEFLVSLLGTAICRKRDALVLAETRKVLKACQHNASIGSWRYDRVTQETRWSDAMFSLYGIDPSDGIPLFLKLAAMVHPDDRRLWHRAIDDMNGPGLKQPAEYRIQRADGTLRWLRSEQIFVDSELNDGNESGLYGTVTDITVQKAFEASLLRNNQLLAEMQKITGLGWWEYNPVSKVTYWSEGMFRLHGLSEVKVVPSIEGLAAMVHPEDRDLWLGMIREVTELGTAKRIEFRITRPSGELCWLLANEAAITQEKGFEKRFFGTLMDITDRKTIENELRFLATTDELTGCLSRRMVFQFCRSAFENVRHGRQTSSILILDIDHFKEINDTYGHATGDTVLRRLSHILFAELRQNDRIGRIGGEEFLILLSGYDLQSALHVAHRLRNIVEKSRIEVSSAMVGCTVSIGAAEIGRCDASFEAVLGRADRALYQVKNSGRNSVGS